MPKVMLPTVILVVYHLESFSRASMPSSVPSAASQSLFPVTAPSPSVPAYFSTPASSCVAAGWTLVIPRMLFFLMLSSRRSVRLPATIPVAFLPTASGCARGMAMPPFCCFCLLRFLLPTRLLLLVRKKPGKNVTDLFISPLSILAQAKQAEFFSPWPHHPC